MSKTKIAITVTGALIAIAAVGIGIWFGVVRAHSSKYNLITLKNRELPAPQKPTEDAFVQLSDVNMHFVKYGEGEKTVILLHGNGGSAKSLSEAAAYLANEYTVYCLESRCHGQSSDPGVITYDLMAKDVYEFINAKGLVKPFVMGHSDGGMVALAAASHYPDLLGAVISCGSNSNPETLKSFFRTKVKINNAFKKDKLNDLMLTLPDFTPEFLGRITAPVLVVAGEFDIMPLSDTVYIHDNIANSEIAIVKMANHSSYMSHDGKQAYALAHDYFSKIQGK
ncbi:MAG: alpha/beta hydrolase [Eubacteriales bacterium]|nr:alpha/beta hydrolase [Christensenellaceae bacterium]MDY2750961.1 alpha/beta hydrolase [Eubacteriales bacterium]MDY6078579.1 alpha/beta hydrolase [Eubacteriales bacterium]